MEEHVEMPKQRRLPIVQTYPSDGSCSVTLDDEAQKTGAETDRIALMIAAALRGVTVTRASGGHAQLTIHVGSYYQDLAGVSATLLNEMLSRLPQEPVLSLERHRSKPYIWLLVMNFPVQRDHLYALRNMPGIMAATLPPDSSYDNYMVELFVPGLGQQGNDGADLLLRALQHRFNFKL